MKKLILISTVLVFAFCGAYGQIITTIAGIDTNYYNGDNIAATTAALNGPYGIALDGKGNFFIADGYNNRIRKVDTAGIITTIAGNGTASYNGDGIPATGAQLYRPSAIAFDHYGNMYFCDSHNNRIRKIDTSGTITTIAGNGIGGYNGDNIAATAAEVNDPHSVAIDVHGNLYITDWNNHRIRKVDIAGVITTIAGTGILGYTGDNGPADTAEINAPYGIALDHNSNIYFVDAYADVVRKIDTFGFITTFAGCGVIGSGGDNGPADSAKLGRPGGLAIDGGNNVYIADIFNNKIRMISAASGIITTVAGDETNSYGGDNGPATLAKLSVPTGITIDGGGNLYIADFGNNRIRRVGWATDVRKLPSASETIAIYPNPATTYLTIEFVNPIVPSKVNGRITIANIFGQMVYQQTTSNASLLTIDISELPAGLYFVRVNDSEARKFLKL